MWAHERDTPALSEPLLTALADVVAARLGLRCPRERWGELAHAVSLLAKEGAFRSTEACADALVRGMPNGPGDAALARHLTNGETYFFRDPACFAALRDTVLPELIRARRAQGPAARRLRLWSAGCATGEEPYSLAMLLEEVLPDIDDWDITLLATDVNQGLLHAAKAGCYRAWSFRGVSRGIKERYFRLSGPERYALEPRVRARVDFAPLNLSCDGYPPMTCGMDLILCRHVLMYFTPACAAGTASRLSHALAEGGSLVVGAIESLLPLYGDLRPVRLSGTMMYRKETAAPAPQAECVPARQAPGPPADDVAEAYRAAHALFRAGRHRDAAEAAAGCLEIWPADPRTCILLARIHANSGALDHALDWSQRALDVNKLDVAAHYTQAVILTEFQEPAKAAEALMRVLYLDPDHALAHYALGMLAWRRGEPARAREHIGDALSILAGRAPDDELDEIDGLTAGRLTAIVQLTDALLTERAAS